MNVLNHPSSIIQFAEVFALLGKPTRLSILLAIGENQACVCHLEKMLGLRQAAISQQLMLMRQAGMVSTRRVGRHIFYHLTDVRWLAMVKEAAAIQMIKLPTYDMPDIQGCEFKPDR
jgi:ArsR family transcriptional regulator